jgi:glycosyltransferase involved in cell wall biosynthesis
MSWESRKAFDSENIGRLDCSRSSVPLNHRQLALGWKGPFLSLESLSLVNRHLTHGLWQRGHRISILGDDSLRTTNCQLRCPLERPADAQVSQVWPPDFTAPDEGHFVVIQPWEYGSLPVDWIRPVLEGVDEIWANSSYVKGVYVRSGVPAERVHVVPLGVNASAFRPGRTPLPLKTKKRFKFLFVGGTIFRKGFDVLLKAYRAMFGRKDDVCLVVKEFGASTFYEGLTSGRSIAKFKADPESPEIEYFDADLTTEQMAGLYCACDCLVHPYRGEGFGLPIAEAMACGLPVIVTGMGAALDFCNVSNAFLIPARKKYCPRKRIGDLETVDLPWLAEPDKHALCDLMRYVHDHESERWTRGRAASEHIHNHFRWDQAVDLAEKRLLRLREMPIRRFAGKNKRTWRSRLRDLFGRSA